MSAEHKRPLYAFVMVSVLCAVMLGHAIRSDALVGLWARTAERVAAQAPAPVAPERRVDTPTGASPSDRDPVALVATPEESPTAAPRAVRTTRPHGPRDAADLEPGTTPGTSAPSTQVSAVDVEDATVVEPTTTSTTTTATTATTTTTTAVVTTAAEAVGTPDEKAAEKAQDAVDRAATKAVKAADRAADKAARDAAKAAEQIAADAVVAARQATKAAEHAARAEARATERAARGAAKAAAKAGRNDESLTTTTTAVVPAGTDPGPSEED